ncbi:hypothetical protein EW145_g3244 [Phellinidium pouzarii]|uniref:N-acetyltransferase domain-containing protein n=1 Tax=Phellinidium pouzarii TaxID=167371 RepID=A0A4S4L897_9AGAM|nr:hypothetical protein EW145_g3244 [Phellinidium pouzarii]
MDHLPPDLFFDLVAADEVSAAHAIELSSLPADEAATLAQLQSRQAQAPELFLGAFLPSSSLSLSSLPPSDTGGLHNRTLIGYTCATRAPAPATSSDSISSASVSTVDHASEIPSAVLTSASLAALSARVAPANAAVCVHAVGVSPPFRQRGVARALMEASVARLRTTRAYEMLLCDGGLRALYEEVGCECVGESENGGRPWSEMRVVGPATAAELGIGKGSGLDGLLEAGAGVGSAGGGNPVGRIASFTGVELEYGIGDVVTLDQSGSVSDGGVNKYVLLCPRSGCGCVILRDGVGKLIQKDAIELEPSEKAPTALLTPLPPAGQPIHCWLVQPSPMAFENIGFSRPVGEELDDPTSMAKLRLACVLASINAVRLALSAPSGFPALGNGLWYTTPGTIWSRHSLPLGNGFLTATTLGGILCESTQLNIESLWTGGPFADPTYNGGNKQSDEQPAMAAAMQSIRQTIFNSANGTIGDVEILTTAIGAYGSYSGAGFLISTLANQSSDISEYGRFLDLDSGIAKTLWSQEGNTFTRETFCSNPVRACVQNTSTTSPRGFTQTYAFTGVSGLPTPNVTCIDGGNGAGAVLQLTGNAGSSAGPGPGMSYELLATVVAPGSSIVCSTVPNANASAGAPNATLTVSNARSAYVVWVGGTDYDANAGDAAHGFSFKGDPPHDALSVLLNATHSFSYAELLAAHKADYAETLHTRFALSIQGAGVDLDVPTDARKAAYEVDTGDPYLEWVLFNYGRHLLASSTRGMLPANLQGKWAFNAAPPWSADYHANINFQMNYWIAETTNMNVTQSIWDYIEMNYRLRDIFGHTGMKASGNSAQWANYPVALLTIYLSRNIFFVKQMVHVWDHFDFTNDVAWWKAQGYPLLKGAASFHLDKLIPDKHVNDGTLVVAPCNSPEQVPITFACAHAQQLIWQLFNAIEKGAPAAGETDVEFLNEVKAKKAQMDKGVHIGSWGQLQEWKVDMDSPNDTHRHLSHLVGLYPGYAIANYDPTIQNTALDASQVLAAAQISLIHRGNGTGPDADAGWEKVWRAACWAQFSNASEFYHELTYAIQRNFAENLFSVYDPTDSNPIFQIDANLGYPAAVMNALIQALDVANTSMPLLIKLLPALPTTWPEGSLTGARVRGGITVDMTWADAKLTKVILTVDEGIASRPVNVIYAGSIKARFNTTSGLTQSITGF